MRSLLLLLCLDPPPSATPSCSYRCVTESALSGELLVRLTGALPRLHDVLKQLPPKMIRISTNEPTVRVEFSAEDVATRVDDVVGSILRSAFTSGSDMEKVPRMYKAYVTRIATMLQKALAIASSTAPVLALGGGGTEAVLPPMPTGATAEALRAWHLEWMRVQHESITDALSGERLDALKGCVQIAVQGTDTSGAPLRLGDAKGLTAWLCGLEGGCVLLTSGPAAGKTWLMSQVVMHTLGERMPVLVKVDQLQTRLAEIEAADDWVDAYLALTLDAGHVALLREAMTTGRALLLLDGLDEAGAHRSRIERHVAEVVARRGCALLCTSRPAGLTEGLFDGFHKLELAPLSDAQQRGFLERRLGSTRAAELAPYLEKRVPVDADTRRRVTANPLMLSMVASIAKLREGIDMPRTTAALYEVAASAMLRRGTVSDAAVALLQATFFEAHADQQRVVTEKHLGAAARHLDAAARRGGTAVDELRDLVVRDRLPLVRLLQAEPLQMQAFHLSFQEYYAMRAVSEGGVRLPSFRWDVWWTNAVFMGVQTGDAFGERFAEAAGLEAPWRTGVVTALVEQGLPAAWLPTVAEVAGGDVARLKAFVGRYRDVLQREGGKAVAQLAAQQPDDPLFRALQERPAQHLLTWRNKPLDADSCVATFAHPSAVNALAVSATLLVGGAGAHVYVYDAATEERLGTLDAGSDVKSVALHDDRIVAGCENGTLKVWNSGER